MQQELLGYYRQHQLERFLPQEKLDLLRVQRFAQGDYICDLEQPVEYLYFFVEGRAKVFLPTAQGRQLLLCFYEPLQIFGDLELFDEAPRATASIAALTPCVCLALPYDVVRSQLASDSAVLLQLYSSLGRKLNRVIRNSALNLLHPLANRLASYILATAAHNKAGELVFTGNLSQIADLLGTTFRHLHRTLQLLCAKGILKKAQKSYRVLQAAELEKFAAGVYMLG